MPANAGWFLDVDGVHQRFHDGEIWTDQVRLVPATLEATADAVVGTWGAVEAGDLEEALHRASKVLPRPASDSVIDNLSLTLTPSAITVAATDMTRIAYIEVPWQPSRATSLAVIVDRAFCAALDGVTGSATVSVASDADGQPSLQFEDDKGRRVPAPTVVGAFPELAHFGVNAPAVTARVDRAALRGVLADVPVGTTVVSLVVVPGHLLIRDTQRLLGRIPAVVEGKPRSVSCTAWYLRDGLDVVAGSERDIEISMMPQPPAADRVVLRTAPSVGDAKRARGWYALQGRRTA